jgi:two-component system, cell cycle sensor histidine kinase and response regulator CckA
VMAREMGDLLAASISKKVEIRFECSKELPLIEGDVAQVHQVLMNLIVNASEAIGDKSGTITVRTGMLHATKNYFQRVYTADDLPEGDYVFLEVSDSGSGMDADIRGRIFDPFFSTKFTGRGLGLAAVLGIVRSHGGAITVYSEPGQGSTFKVLFPIMRRALRVEQPETPPQEETLSSWRGEGLLLVADDEEMVLDVARIVLEERGFTVRCAVNGQEIVDLVREHTSDVKAVLLDLTMPIMGGKEALKHIRAIQPDMRVVLTSGYTEQDVVLHLSEDLPTAFIQKPFTPEEMVRTLQKVLSPA